MRLYSWSRPVLTSLPTMSTKATPPPPAYFLSLSLENVRSFGAKQTIHFTEGGKEGGRPAQWTIILGDNGVGKTTVLKALAGMTYEKGSFHHDPYVSMPRLWRYADNTWFPLRFSGAHPAVLLSSVSIGVYMNDINKELNIQNVRVQLGADLSEMDSRKRLMSHTSIGNPANLICYGYGAGRSTGYSNLSKANDNQDTCISLFDDQANLLNPEEWFMQMEYSFLRKGGAKNAAMSIETVRQALLDILLDVDDIAIRNTETNQPQLELLSPYGWVRLRDMSLGYQTLVVWLTDFASKLFIRYPDSPNPLEMPAIVLIDEIDLHLHPSWQRKLIGFLSGIFKNTQFIATAHSPLVVQAAGDAKANVVLLKREGDQTIVYQGADLPDVHRWRVDQILSSELFDETPARSPETEQQVERRDALLAKRRLSAKEKVELAQLNEALGTQPVGSGAGERQAADVLRELARKLGKQELLD